MSVTRKVCAALCAGVFCFAALAPLSTSFAIIDVGLPVEPPETKEPPATEEVPVTEESEVQTPYPDRIPFGMRGAKLYLVCVEEDAIIYEADKESTFVEAQKGDSLLMIDIFSDKEWTCIALSGMEKAYIKTEYLRKTKSGKSVSRKKLVSNKEVFLVCAEKTCTVVYAGEEGGEAIGVMRKGIALPLLWFKPYKGKYGSNAKIATYQGIGYIYDGTYGGFWEEDWYWSNMYE